MMKEVAIEIFSWVFWTDFILKSFRVMNLFVNREANRRWSMALSSMGHSQASAQSLQSISGPDIGIQRTRSDTY